MCVPCYGAMDGQTTARVLSASASKLYPAVGWFLLNCSLSVRVPALLCPPLTLVVQVRDSLARQ